jgi:MEMO1 family protein
MTLRKRELPSGWYPTGKKEVSHRIKKWQETCPGKPSEGLAGTAPHAGWDFSGELASKVFAGLNRDIDTVAVVGGHLPSFGHIMAAPEDGFETPLGTLESDKELLDYLRRHIDIHNDDKPDNTVEIQLPFVKYFFENAKVLYMRAPPSTLSINLGEALYSASIKTGKRISVVGSTDLTHYGPAYGFEPRGSGASAERWVREENDKALIDLLLSMDLNRAVEHAELNRSACSVGGAVCAAAFAGKLGITRGVLLEYRSSLDIHTSSSFVGYAGILYCR